MYEQKRVGKEGVGKRIVTGLLLPIKYPILSVPPGNDTKPHQLPTLPIKIKTTKKEAAWQGV